MKTSQIYTKIKSMTGDAYALSDGIVNAEKDEYDFQYLSGKVQELENVVKHIKDQLKHKSK